mmetsp:Transcript_23522/g.31544  ORF Transcript_23522/g.31544 Transcript_23522/m.31544 type:complete len:110 (-) Transcript_23522:1771-2100(-)
MKLPRVDADWEPVLLLHYDFSFHFKAAAEQNVENVGGGADIVNSLIDAVLLLAEVAVELLDSLGGPRFEGGHLVQVVQSLCLLHVLDVEDLVVEGVAFQHEADRHAVSQ